MPLSDYIILVKFHGIQCFSDCLCFQSVILYEHNFRRYLYFGIGALKFHMNMDWFMVIRVEEKPNSKIKEAM